MIFKVFLYFIYVTNSEVIHTYPTRNWLKICNSTKFYNKSAQLRDYLRENLDTLYL